ncbi:anti-restriction nuclease [Enterobacter phage vB_EclM-UFV01]|nr:anti-restriction nuclease [Enterobacter phage vB_EclM-UFV01]
MKMNIKLIQIESLRSQINALKKANEMMHEQWTSLTNESGWSWLSEAVVKKLTINNDPWMWNGTIKPLFAQYYVMLNLEMIKELERQIKKLEEQDEQSSSKA